MRYAQRGGYTPEEQERRERLRMRAAERFERGESVEANSSAGVSSSLRRAVIRSSSSISTPSPGSPAHLPGHGS